MPRDIVAILVVPETARTCLETAAAAADGAYVIEAFHVRLEPESLILPTEEVMTPARRAELTAMLAERSRCLLLAYRDWAESAGEIGHNGRWSEVVGKSLETEVIARSKRADLVVMARPREPEGEAALRAAIFDTGRLLLLASDRSTGAPLRLCAHIAI